MPLIGHTRCTDPECGAADIPVYRTSGGKVYAACHRCEMTQQPKPGSAGHRRLMRRTVLVESEGDPPAPAAAPRAPADDGEPAAPPAIKNPQRMARVGFQLGTL
ncbi:MAG TPA: hypothetical protein PKJ12_02030 [Ottowia sp.]|nr:hypothetical protein [Ottowia sp.]HNT85191.1 hypothetical protein [Ottowia sp.]